MSEAAHGLCLAGSGSWVQQSSVTVIGNPHFGKPYAVNLNHAYEELEGIVEQVSVQLDIGCVVENLER
ncbi:hypothetical protein [uncultured Tateyamaria sp.]|uniref:hypothetical protein n=1 Tax=uncultured Tateyamaria sp. TaxID=455651 RepID=UPI002633C3AF|nr:hypothetical protein [uncultured Tateyamaria sp.]